MGARSNRSFRLARRAQALTQAQVAAKVADLVEQATGRCCGIDADYISKIERGEIRWPGAAYRSAFRALLGTASDADLGLWTVLPPVERKDADHRTVSRRTGYRRG